MSEPTTTTKSKPAKADSKNDERPLADRLAESQAKGYVGFDAGDVRDGKVDGVAATGDLDGPSYGGVGIDGTPGGHPNDPTVGSVVGAGSDTGL